MKGGGTKRLLLLGTTATPRGGWAVLVDIPLDEPVATIVVVGQPKWHCVGATALSIDRSEQMVEVRSHHAHAYLFKTHLD